MWTVLIIVISGAVQVLGLCPKVCRCPPDVPTCAPGVSVMLDLCRCCKVCARQLNEDCSKTEPCDRTKGLECNVGSGLDSSKGVCRAKSDGRACEYNGRIYQNGESFRPNCKHQCTCTDGAVGCVSLCPDELTIPKLGCAEPRRLKVRGAFCDQVICTEEEKRSREDELTNELVPVRRGGVETSPDIGSHPVGNALAAGVKCQLQTTAWSPCSKSCGTGVFKRLSNNNIQCKLVKETRVCEVRPCAQMIFSRMKKCNYTAKASYPVKLSYAGCHSLKKFWPRYCRACSDGRCCRPHRTPMVPVQFQCRDGRTFNRKMMMIQSCTCNFQCSKPPALHTLPYTKSPIGIHEENK
ncbi:CCN family member 1-like [Thalassophryne amazonica]|uniref:CCN family member 1-like n=1 Tax=Thalassophryne amazonica TaxID=390379 RepID=UPI001471EB1E|nr:CCN family member 1-like [Thalassophryne amazonica]